MRKSKLFNRELREIFFPHRKQQFFYFFLVLIFNTVAALLEGTSFAMILLALTALDSQNTFQFSSIPFLSNSFFSLFLENLERQRFFVFCAVFATGFQILRSAFAFLAQLFSATLGTNIQNEAQKKIYAQILRLSFPCVSRYKTGDLVQYANTPSNMVMPLLESFNKAVISALTIVVLVVLMLKISVCLTAMVILLFVVFGWAQRKIFQKIVHFSRRFAETSANFSKHIVQSLHGIRPIHLFNRQKEVLGEIKELVEKTGMAIRKLNYWHLSITPINEIIGISLVGICLILGPYFLKLEPATLISCLLTFITVTYRLATRTQLLISEIGGMTAYAGSLWRLNEILRDDDKQFVSDTGSPIAHFQGKIEYRDVSLQYRSGLPFALQEISCEFPRGSFTALVGSSGSGKSSLIDLLLRLYESSSGRILIDGIDLQDYSVKSWRALVGVVSQDTFIFNETIEENIRFGLRLVTHEEVVTIAKVAGVHEFVSRMPDGYQTIVGERGYRLSGGERQRIALARVLLRKPEILILDEATSNLDSYSEFLIQQAIEELHHQKTIIAIAHRLSTIVKADRILVLDQGKIVEQGTHEELIRLGGKYAKFWQIQSMGSEMDVLKSAKLGVL